jgi:simple sugar transport system permease protein
MNDAMIGEYFRVFICYGVIAMSLVMHAWKKKKEKKTLDAGGDTSAASADLLESK